LANRTVIQTIKAELSLKILPWRQPERHKDTDILCLDCEFADDPRTKAAEKTLGIFKFGQFLQDTPVQLHSFVQISRKS
jgi:hypothetical protein